MTGVQTCALPISAAFASSAAMAHVGGKNRQRGAHRIRQLPGAQCARLPGEITTTPALFGDVLEYEGKFYKVGTVRQEVKDTKVEDDSFYLLTLAFVSTP